MAMPTCELCEEVESKVFISFQEDAANRHAWLLCWSCAAAIVCRMPHSYAPDDEVHPSIVLAHLRDNANPEEEHPLKRHRTTCRFLDHLCHACSQFQEAFSIQFSETPADSASSTTRCCYYCTAAMFLKFHCKLAKPVDNYNAIKDL